MKTISPQKKAAYLPLITEAEAGRRHLLDEQAMMRMGLMPCKPPVAHACGKEGEEILYYDPDKVKEAPRDYRYPRQQAQAAPHKAPVEPTRISPRRAATLGYFPRDVLLSMYYEPTEAPVAFYIKKSGERVELFDRATCRRLPLPCAKCGGDSRYRAKLCRTCYTKELAMRRAVGDKRRSAAYGMARERVLFFDLEMTGVYDHDEVLSVTVVNGHGETLLDTLTRPQRKKRWRDTEKIHGITPDMVKDAPTMVEITPQLTALLAQADRIVSFGSSTDFFHLARLYSNRAERVALKSKLLDCGTEFAHYIHEHEIELQHLSLSDAMAHFTLPWDGVAHTSAADTNACRLVFEALFPHYYEGEPI